MILLVNDHTTWANRADLLEKHNSVIKFALDLPVLLFEW